MSGSVTVKTLVFVDAENVGFLWAAQGPKHSSRNQRRRLLLASMVDHSAQMTGSRPEDVAVVFHWSDPANRGLLVETHAAARVIERAGARWRIHPRIERKSEVKSTTDIGLAVNAVDEVSRAEGRVAVVLATGDCDFIPLITWIGERSTPVHLLHIQHEVYWDVKQAIRRTGGRYRYIGPDRSQERPSEVPDRANKGSLAEGAEVPLTSFLPGTSTDRLQVLERLLAGVSSGLLRSKADLDQAVGPAASVVVPALTTGGPKSPYGRLIVIRPGGQSLDLNTATKDWVREANVVWIAAAVCAQVDRIGQDALASSREQLIAMGTDPISATSGVARAAQAIFKPDYIATAKGHGIQCPNDPVARRALVDAILADGPDGVSLGAQFSASVGLAMRADPERKWSVDDLDAAWVATVISRNPPDSWATLLAPAGPVSENFLFGLPTAQALNELAAIEHWTHQLDAMKVDEPAVTTEVDA